MTALSKLSDLFARRYRETIFVSWVSIIMLRAQYLKFKRRKLLKEKNLSKSGEKVVRFENVDGVAEEDEKDELEETVKVHGAKFQFTKTNGGVVVPGLKDAMLYFLPVFIRILESLYMSLDGKRFFKNNPPREKVPLLLFASFCLLPLLELVIQEDWANPTRKTQNIRGNSKLYRLPLYLWSVVEIYTTFKTIKYLVDPDFALKRLDKIWLWLSLAFFNGALGITVAHELVHKNSRLEKFLGYMLLCNVNYMHWGEEHLTGHHEHVATPSDPATARLNESLYQFLPRTLIGSFISSNQIEKRRLEKENKSQISLHNRTFWCVVLPLAWALTIGKLTKGGWKAIALFYSQGLGAASMLEVVNYIEHYGLLREKLPDGTYEPVDPTHSWNSPHRLSNTLLFKLQRHSDHHTYAMRPYHLLRNFKESPQLPSGYPGMYLLAFFPPAFFWIMNPLVEAHSKHKKEIIEKKLEHSTEENFVFEKSEELLQAEMIAKLKLGIFLSAVVTGFYNVVGYINKH